MLLSMHVLAGQPSEEGATDALHLSCRSPRNYFAPVAWVRVGRGLTERQDVRPTRPPDKCWLCHSRSPHTDKQLVVPTAWRVARSERPSG